MDSLLIDFESRLVFMPDGRKVILPLMEFKILAHLYSNKGNWISCNEILQAVWGDGWIDDKHLIHVHICRIRRKLGNNNNHQYISTKHEGYILN